MSIIAEIGTNHEGNMNLARLMIQLAKENGADMAKFQLYDPDKIFEKGTPVYDDAVKSQISFEQAKELFKYGENIGIEVFFSVFDLERLGWCEEIGVSTYKVACRSCSDLSLLPKVYETGKRIIQSVPADNIFDGKLVDVYRLYGAELLFCFPEYPATLKYLPDFNEYDGYSDHTIGLDAAKLAIARGANIIEKHFCYRHDIGVDAQWSMDADELKELSEWEKLVKSTLSYRRDLVQADCHVRS